MSETLEMVKADSAEAARFLPVMNIHQAITRRDMIQQAVGNLMEEGKHFGTIPGTKVPTLYQPGADMLNTIFGLVPQFEVIEKVLDWTGEGHAGESFFYYEFRCRLIRGGELSYEGGEQIVRGGFLMGEGRGSCNSWESKYRYRKGERVCPSCGQAAIIKGKAEYGGGWLCYRNKGGCGDKFPDDDPSIIDQQVGKIPNDDIADLVNTVLKMAMKRAKIAATLNALAAHEFFGQDLEDLPPDTFKQERPPRQQTQPQGQNRSGGRPAEFESIFAPVDEGEDVEIPGPLMMQLNKCGDQKVFLNYLAEYKNSFSTEIGSDIQYHDALKQQGITAPAQIRTMETPARRELLTLLYYRLENARQVLRAQKNKEASQEADMNDAKEMVAGGNE